MVVLGLLQVGTQVDRLITVGGPEVEVADKYLGPKGRCQQQCRRDPFAHRGMAEPHRKAASPQHHGRDAKAAEGVKPDGQPRLGPDAGGPKPDKYGGQQGAASIGTGGLSAAKAGGRHSKGGGQHQRE